MKRNERVLIQKKQEKDIAKTGNVSASSIKEGQTITRYISGNGLYLICKHNNKLYYNKFTESF